MDETLDLSGRYAEALGHRAIEFGGMTPRELTIYLAGQSDGANIKSDAIQPILSRLEMERVTFTIPVVIS